jgi:hypothetical protein
MPLGYAIWIIITNYYHELLLWTLRSFSNLEKSPRTECPNGWESAKLGKTYSFQIHSNFPLTFPRTTFVTIGSWESDVKQDTFAFVLQWTQQCLAHTHFVIWASHRRRHPQWSESRQNIRLCSMASSASTPTWLTARPRIPPLQQVMRFSVSIHQWLYSPLLGLGLFFSFVIFLYTDGRTPWTSD